MINTSSINTSTPVLLLRSARHGGLAITRTLGRLGVKVYVIDADTRAPSFFSKYCRGRFVWDFDQAPEAHSLEYLAAIGRALERPAILLPTADTTALFVATHASELQQRFLFPALSAELVQSLYSKKKMHQLAESLGVPTPNTFFPASRQDVMRFSDYARFPIIVKPIESHKAPNPQARKKAIVHGRQELLENYERMENPESPNLILQEYIPGGEDANWMFNGYFNSNSECLLGLTGRKIRQYEPYFGITSLGVCEPNATVVETTKNFMKAIGYRGILDMGYRYDRRDGLYKAFDVNPRIGCTFRLFVTDNGMDVARALYLDLTGQPVAAGRDIPGRKWMVEDIDMASAFHYWRDGNLTPGGWFRSFRGVQESAFFASDDPRPLISMCVQGAEKLYQRFRSPAASPSSSDSPRPANRANAA